MQAKQNVICVITQVYYFFKKYYNIINNIIINMYVRGTADWRQSDNNGLFFLPLDNNLKTKTMLGFFYLNFSFSSFIIDRALQHVLQLNCYDLTLPSVFYSVCSIYCI